MNFSEIFLLVTDAAQNTGIAEWLAFIAAIAYVILAAYENTWCWFFALVSTIFYFYVCLVAKLYLETILQVFYFAMGIYGWYQWMHSKAGKKNMEIVSYPFKKNIPFLITGLIFSPVIGFVFARYTNASQPWLDAAITTFSFIGTWMVAKKILENWIFWIVIDATAILLYSNKQLYLTSLLYFIYTVLAVYGYVKWKKVFAIQPNQ